MVQHVGREPARLVPALDDPVHHAEHRGAVAGRERVHDLIQQAGVGEAEQGYRPLVGQAGLVAPGQQLVKHRQRVPRRSRPGPDHQRQHRVFGRHALGAQDVLHQVPEHRRGHEAERVVVRAGPDGRDDLLRLGGGEDELQVRRRLLHQLQQRVEALLGDHVRLVDDVDLEAPRHRRVEGPLAQFPGVVHAAVRGGVDLDHVDAARPGRRQGHAGVADPAGFGGGPVDAVQGAGQDAGAGGLAAAARAAEQVRVVDPAGAQRLAQRAGDVILALHLGEGGRTVLAV